MSSHSVTQALRKVMVMNAEYAQANLALANAAATLAMARISETDLDVSIADLVEAVKSCETDAALHKQKLHESQLEFAIHLSRILVKEDLVDRFIELMQQL
jgi:hypothetical protein